MLYFNQKIEDQEFSNVVKLLDNKTLIVFNNTRVIKARIWFRKPTGKLIEIFCLEPSKLEMTQALSSYDAVEWNCFIGGAKRWKSGPLVQELEINGQKIELSVEKGERIEDYFRVVFSWNNKAFTLSEILEAAGNIPLPPYIDRDVQNEDSERYQTVYSSIDGSVAAPTAGLHFTPEILDALKANGVDLAYLTLHVGAGTFKPVQSDVVGDHGMHEEYFEVDRTTLTKLIDTKYDKIIAVGTTSVRTLESLYWLGSQAVLPTDSYPHLAQWDPYENHAETSPENAISRILTHMEQHDLEVFRGSTSLMIGPGYNYRMIDGMFTNFHLPKSTLLLLVSALVGDRWRDIYEHALNSGYQFLSYGDSSLLMK